MTAHQPEQQVLPVNVHDQRQLRRELGVFGATMMGLGAIVGTGVFVSIGMAAGATGPSVVLAIALAGLVAMCNAFSSAQLAAAHPVSGGTYEYGYTFLNPTLGFSAGWLFLCVKTASAATAALGFAGYALHMAGTEAGVPKNILAAGAVVFLTLIVLCGMRQSSFANIIIVSITLLALLAFLVEGFQVTLSEGGRESFAPFFAPIDGRGALSGFLEAAALLFVAYTGYGRIATLGEEVKEPRRTIPRAIVATLIISALLYIAVAVVAVGVLGTEGLAAATKDETAPLVVAARALQAPALACLVAFGAITAMLGVLLNLILGLSRVILAMARREDFPRLFARLNRKETTPIPAVLLAGACIAVLSLFGSVKTAWSFSAFTVLVYYALTNLAALRLPKKQRIFPRFYAWCGLMACLFLAFWVEPAVWMTGLGLLGAGLLWQRLLHRVYRRRTS